MTDGGQFWQIYRRSPAAMVWIMLLLSICCFVFLGPFLWGKDPNFIFADAAQMMANRNLSPHWAAPFGTDHLGRDLLARMMAGGRITLLVGFAAMLTALTLGSAIGLVAGYVRRLDPLLMRLTDLFLALPVLPLLLVLFMLAREPLALRFGSAAAALILVVLGIGLTSWMPTAKILRAQVLSLREQEFILAAQSLGARRRHIVLRHILPNVTAPITISASLGLASAILSESALSFLGLGFPPDVATWGRMLFEGTDYMRQYPLRFALPGLGISLTVLCAHLIGEGLRRAFDPRQSQL